MKNKLLLGALALIATINAIVLAGVASNRAGAPDAVLALTERELPQSWRSGRAHENTGIALELQYAYDAYDWFDQSKLHAVGFDADAFQAATARAYGNRKEPLPRKAYAVLEYEGPAWAARLRKKEAEIAGISAGLGAGEYTRQDLERAQRSLEEMRETESRLVPIDVGLDPAALRARYPDASRYLITAAEVRMHIGYSDPKRRGEGHAQGNITRLLTSPIHLPRRFHATLVQATRRQPAILQPPRYTATVRYGTRFEPWVVDLQAINGGDEPQGLDR
jgi:hypothetical protein